MPKILALCNIGEGENAEPVVFSGCAPSVKVATGCEHWQIQNAGHAFFDKFERVEGSDDEAVSSKANRKSGKDEPTSPQNESSPKKKGKKLAEEALKLPECLKDEDLYALIEVDSSASQDDLKKAWRKICLVHHPDKIIGKTDDEVEAANEYFVKLQEAFNILSVEKKRRKYDSMGEFDETLPTKLSDGEDFYEVFSAGFKKEAKWSERKPVPELGDENTNIEKVKAFYDFWFDFETWRNLDELIMEENGEDCFQDLEDAECREEKRWMERENARLRGKYHKTERQRVFAFVELAEKLDPRIRAEKDKQNAARDAAKAAKDAKRLEAERLAKEEAERKAAEEEKERLVRAEEKARREEEKQVRKVARGKLRNVVKELQLGLAEDPLQEFFVSLDLEETEGLIKELEACKDGETLFTAMKNKGVEPIFSKEDEKSTEEGDPSEEEVVDPEELARREKEQKEKERIREKRRKEEEAKNEKIRAAEAAKRAEEKKVKDAQKKVEQEKKAKELEKANQKEAQRLKREEEKVKEKEAKAAEKARLEKEAQRKKSEEQSAKQKAEKEAEEATKDLETRTFEFERERLGRADAYDKLSWPEVVETSKTAAENPIIASGLAAAAAAYTDPEELLDAQLGCLGTFFVLGRRPEEGSLALSSSLRNRVKKIRTKIRGSAGELTLTAPEGTKSNAETMEQLIRVGNGEAPPPELAELFGPAETTEEAASGKDKKKKAKAKAAPAAGEDDLDALLEEFGVQTTSKKKGKKK